MTFLCLAQDNCVKKETLTRVFFCEFCRFSKNTFSYRTSLVVAFVILLSWLWNHFQSQQQKSKVRFVGSLCGGAEWRGVPVKQVVSGGFWVVSDGFCWLRVISNGFRWFAVLVVTRISQHTEELFLYCTHERTWLTEVIRFFYSKQDSKKKIIVVLSPSRLKTSDYFLYSVVLFLILLFPILYSLSYKKLLLKEIF